MSHYPTVALRQTVVGEGGTAKMILCGWTGFANPHSQMPPSKRLWCVKMAVKEQ